MIQDIFPHRLNNQYRPGARPTLKSRVLCYTEDGVLCSIDWENRRLQFPSISEFQASSRRGQKEAAWSSALEVETLPVPREHLTYLFSVDEEDFFLLFPEADVLPAGASYQPVRKLRSLAAGPRELIFAALTGLQLYNWYRNNRYCGRCGGRTVHDERERAIRCPGCGHLIYPRIVPAVIVGVISADGRRLLLTKYRTGFAHYALVAGFTEIGETLEETVAREVMEETGLPVRDIRYYKSQPWGIVDDLLAGFYCNADDSRPIRMDESELKLAEWKTRDEIVLQPDDFSLTNEMMQRFKEGFPC